MLPDFLQRHWGLVLVLLFATTLLVFCGCDTDEEGDDCDVPSGYYEVSRYVNNDYEEIIYERGNHWVICTTLDGGDSWSKAEHWN